MSAVSLGPINWSLQRDDDGHREYSIEHRVETTSISDGPAIVTWATGLPVVGSYWAFGNDVDVWAYCYPTMSVTPEFGVEPGKFWIVRQKFSTKPFKRCQDQSIEDPLLEPAKISGGFSVRSKLFHTDKDGALIKTSSHEMVSLEKDIGDPTVSIDINTASIDLPTFVAAIHKLNDATLWGMAARKIKLTNASWTRNVYGVCSYYYTQHFEFEVRDDGWDESEVADAGFRCLRGKWSTADPPVWAQDAGVDQTDPSHFIVAKDPNDEQYSEKILLNGSGGRLVGTATPVFIPTVQLYGETNFLTLGIPSSLTS